MNTKKNWTFPNFGKNPGLFRKKLDPRYTHLVSEDIMKLVYSY